MKIKTNDRDDVSKFTHKDGSETTIKIGVSREYVDSDMAELQVDRHKYSVIISTSVGCQMGCKMCGIDPKVYEPLPAGEIIQNVKDAIKSYGKNRLKDKYIKLCFMGMGEPLLKNINMSTVPLEIIRWAISKGYACGVDGVDYGTILPETENTNPVGRLENLNMYLLELFGDKRNPNNDWTKRSLVRVFYSLHSTDQITRRFLIPRGRKLTDLEDLYLLDSKGINVIIHYTFINGINDHAYHVSGLIRFMQRNPEFQLRLLRYNSNGLLHESTHFQRLWCILEDNLVNIKMQISPGKDVRGACGQFY